MQHTVYFFDGFQLDVTRRKLISSGGLVLSVSSRAMDALLLLVTNAGQIVEKRRLMETVWPDAVVEDNNLNQCIVSIRKALGETAGSNRFVMTVPGRGYCFVCPVSTASRESTASAPVARSQPPYVAILVSMAVIATLGAIALPRITGPAIQADDAAASAGIEETSAAIILRLRQPGGADKPPEQTSAALLRCLSQRPGMKLRVFVQLVPDGSDTALWSGEYSAGRSDVLNMQSEPARSSDSPCQALLQANP
ncbi:MAG: transcriptional regulator [Steroidobacteraceae bacterium]